ncbi:hypothetical protein R0K04_19090, partial [Pseudoalteromonas sp. SIMBA_153]
TKSDGNYYYYLAQYAGKQKDSSRRERFLFSFGRADKALQSLTLWLLDSGFFPVKLRKMGYTAEHLREWKKKIEEDRKNVTPTTKNVV